MSRPRASFRHAIAVEEADIDELGHVNNVAYLRYIEEVARAHAEREGMGLEVLRGLGVVPVVHRHVITYHRPAKLGDRLQVSTEVALMRRARAERRSEVRLEESGLLLAEATTEWVWVDPLRGRPKPVPAAVLEAFDWS